jgi:hypothetical protein
MTAVGGFMSERFSSTLTWEGEEKICNKLVNLIPEGIDFSINSDADNSTLTINVTSDSLEGLREIVDKLLADFSDQDE